MIKLVLFDLDGTLVDAYRAVHQSVNHTITALGFKARSYDEIKRAVGMGDKHLLAHFVGQANKEKAARIYRTHHAAALAKKGNVRFLPGARSLLKYLKKNGYGLGIVTNRPERFTGIILEGLDMKGHFDMVLCADRTRCPKPDPGMLLMALRRKKLTPAQALFVGDMDIDIKTGQNAGVRTIAVATGSCSLKELKTLQPYRIISKIAKIKITMKELSNE